MKILHITSKRILTSGARFVSTVLNPLLMPTYGALIVLWASILCLYPTGTRFAVLLIIMGLTCIMPMVVIGALQHFGLIKDKVLAQRRERTIPYVAALLCYVAAAAYLNRVHAPQWFVMFMMGSALAVLATLLINLRWKISAHMVGISGVVALVLQLHKQSLNALDLELLLCFTILLAGCLGTARLVLNRHNVLQVLAGAVVGYVCVDLVMRFLS